MRCLRCTVEDSHEFRHPCVVMEKNISSRSLSFIMRAITKITCEGEHRGDDFDSSVSWLKKTGEIQVCHIYLLNFFFLK